MRRRGIVMNANVVGGVPGGYDHGVIGIGSSACTAVKVKVTDTVNANGPK